MTDRPESKRQLNDDQLERLLDELDIEKAPASLNRRLMAISETEPPPRPDRSRKGWLPAWLLAPAFAAAPLALFVALMMQPKTPSDAEVLQARQDLALAFEYIQGVSADTGLQIQGVLGDGLNKSIKGPLSRHMPYTEQSHKETRS